VHEILKLDIVALVIACKRYVPCDPLELVKIATANLSFVIVTSSLDAQSFNFFRVPFSDVLVRSICDREIFTRVCRGFKTFCTQRTNLHIFFFIHSNPLTKSFFEVKFSWSVGDAWPKVKVRFPRDLHNYWSVFSFKVLDQITGKRTLYREYLSFAREIC